MQFGSLTLDQWNVELHTTLASTRPLRSPRLPPPPTTLSESSSADSASFTRETTAPTTPVAPLTWAARVASGSVGVKSPPKYLPAPRRPPVSAHTSVDMARSSSSTSCDSVPLSAIPSAPASPRGATRRRRRPRVDYSVPLPPRALRGLVNAGNSCFINVVLQALLACDPLRRLLLACRGLAPQGSLLAKFVRFAVEMSAGVQVENGSRGGLDDVGEMGAVRKENGIVTGDPFVPDWFFDVFPGSVGGGQGGLCSQEDAEEFLTYILNGLHEELVALDGVREGDVNGAANGGSSVTVGEEEDSEDGVWEEMTRKGKTVEVRGAEFAQSGITDIFGGALRSELKRARQKTSVTREPFFSLSVDIESGMIRDVEHAFAAYFEPELVEGCTSVGGESVDARKHVLLESCPRVLVLHLKRFSHNSVTGALNKVSRMIGFGQVLHVPAKLVHGSKAGGSDGKRYELTAVVTHIGKELAGGHYTCDVRRREGGDDVWVSCDDSKVARTSVGKVVRKQAYLLFYSLTH